MSLVIRLTRTGKNGERKFRVIVKEKRSKRDGGYLDLLGWYEKGGKDNSKQEINMEKYKYWMDHGAQPSETVAKLVNK